MRTTPKNTELEQELMQVKLQLAEATDTLEAIRNGGVDALVVKGSSGHQLYTLNGANLTYRVFFEKMNEGALTLTKEGMILYCNNSFAEKLKIPLEKAVGKSIIDFARDEEKNSFKNVIAKAWMEETKGEILLVKSDGSLNPFLFSLTTLVLNEGIALSMILTDLSFQKSIEQELQTKNKELAKAKRKTEMLNDELEYKVKERTKELLISKEHFNFLADNIPVIAWTAMPDGEITYFNKRWYEYTGFKDVPLTFSEWHNVIHPDDKPSIVSAWNTSLKTAEPYMVEYRFLRASDNTYRWHYGNAVAHKDENGKVQSWFGISADIDEQKKNLERKDEFISTVSHELKTPVTSLKGFTQLLKLTIGKDIEPALAHYLTTMDNQINKLTRLISDLLDATKFNGGQLQFNNEKFNFNELVNETVAEMKLTTDKHQIVVELNSSCSIFGDRIRIGQVITNLISNAIKYSPANTTIFISSNVSKNQLIFYVKDSGIGISKSQQHKLFTRFFRASEEEGNTFPGMGLGLYISMNIIEKHNGLMWVESELGQGASFYFSLISVD